MPAAAPAAPTPQDRLILKLQSVCPLSTDEIAALQNLPLVVTRLQEDADVLREGDRPTQCCLLLEGFLFRYKMLPTGARQITSIHVSGDMPDLQTLRLQVMDHCLGALASSTVAFIPHRVLLALVAHHPGIGAALWRETLIDAAIFREWVVNVGRRSSTQRAAHLFCEFYAKMKAVGLAEPDGCVFPMTQAELGDAMGISGVHVNRTLKELRSLGLIVLQPGRLGIPDWEALKRFGLFDPTYLHMASHVEVRAAERPDWARAAAGDVLHPQPGPKTINVGLPVYRSGRQLDL